MRSARTAGIQGGDGRPRTPGWVFPLAVLVAAGCPYITDQQAFDRADLDGDGHAWQDDCDEGDPRVHSGAEERCNSIDDDCDGAVDEEAADALVWHRDDDGDGFGAGGNTTTACEGGADWTLIDGDCDDADPDVNPDAEERCNNGLDDDCDGGANDCPFTGEHTVDDVADAWWVGNSGSGIEPTAAGGDLDGDGVGDLVLGEPEALAGKGRALVWYGPIGPGSLGTPDAELQGRGSASLGLAVGDLNGDGADELLVGAPTATVTSGGLQLAYAGEVTLLSGGPRLAGVITLDGMFSQGGHDAGHGRAIAALSDGSGARVAVVESGSWAVSGALRLYERTGALLASAGGAACALQTVAALDTDGDGVDEVYVGSPTCSDAGSYAGAVWGIPGDATGSFPLADAPVTFTSPGPDAYFGWALAGADLDGDGRRDLLVGAPTADDRGGTVYGYTGPAGTGIAVEAAALRIAAASIDSLLGFAVAAAGDLDGDGADDILVSTPTWSDLNEGRVGVFYGPLSGQITDTDADAAFVGASSGALVGIGAAAVGDPSGDGVPDLTIAGIDGDGLPRVYLLFGRGL